MTATIPGVELKLGELKLNAADPDKASLWMVTACLRLPDLPPALMSANVVQTHTSHNPEHRRICYRLDLPSGRMATVDCDLTWTGEKWDRALIYLHFDHKEWTIYVNAADTPAVFTQVFSPGELVMLRTDIVPSPIAAELLGPHVYKVTRAKEVLAWCRWPGTRCQDGQHDPMCHTATARELVHPQRVQLVLAETGDPVVMPDGRLVMFSGLWIAHAVGVLLPLWRFADASEATPTGASTRLGAEG